MCYREKKVVLFGIGTAMFSHHPASSTHYHQVHKSGKAPPSAEVIASLSPKAGTAGLPPQTPSAASAPRPVIGNPPNAGMASWMASQRDKFARFRSGTDVSLLTETRQFGYWFGPLDGESDGDGRGERRSSPMMMLSKTEDGQCFVTYHGVLLPRQHQGPQMDNKISLLYLFGWLVDQKAYKTWKLMTRKERDGKKNEKKGIITC